MDMCVQYQVVALQAVMADLLGGDTIHHALGIDPFESSTPAYPGKKMTDVARRVEHMRWMVIDEISMVSAPFLAEIDMRLRSVVSN